MGVDGTATDQAAEGSLAVMVQRLWATWTSTRRQPRDCGVSLGGRLYRLWLWRSGDASSGRPCDRSITSHCVMEITTSAPEVASAFEIEADQPGACARP